LDTLKKFTTLSEIVWPVFKLADKQPVQRDGLVFFYTEYVDNNNSTSFNARLVDDKNLPQPTLGLRRLALKAQGEKLYPVRTAVYLLADLIKLGKSTAWFVDSSGRVFQYQKNTRAKLTTKKIKQVLPADGIGCVIELEGISSRFLSLHRPSEHEHYARVLNLGMGFLFYGFCETVKPDSWRMV
jgi:hypothetical protein